MNDAMRCRVSACLLVVAMSACSGGDRDHGPALLACPPGTTHIGAPYPKGFSESCVKPGPGMVKHGPSLEWARDGRLKYRGDFVDGKPDGFHMWENEDGSYGQAGAYDHGAAIGLWRTWGPGGVLTQTTLHLEGGSLDTWYEPDGVTVNRTVCTWGGRMQWIERGPGTPTRPCRGGRPE